MKDREFIPANARAATEQEVKEAIARVKDIIQLLGLND